MINLTLSICAAIVSIVMLFLSERFPRKDNSSLLFIGSAVILALFVYVPLIFGRIHWHLILIVAYAVSLPVALFLGENYYTREARLKATNTYAKLVAAAKQAGWDISQHPVSDHAEILCKKYFSLPYFLPFLELRLNGATEDSAFDSLNLQGFAIRNQALSVKMSNDCTVFLWRKPKTT